MKKLVIVSSLVLLLATGCNSKTNNLPSNYGETRTREFEGEKEVFEAVKVTSPKAGDRVSQGYVYSIKWKFSIKENLTISLCNEQSCNFIAQEVPNTGEYKWEVSSVPGNNYYIEVYPSGARERVGRSGVFSITQAK